MVRSRLPQGNSAPRARLSIRRRLVYAILPLLLAVVLVELGGRCVFFQFDGRRMFAVQRMYDALAGHVRDRVVERAVDRAAKDFARAEALSPADERERHAALYEPLFDRFVSACRRADARLVIVYVPAADRDDSVALDLFARLTGKHGLPLLDLSPHVRRFPTTRTYLLPEDGHLSRFGNYLLVDALVPVLEPMLHHRSSVELAERPELLGDLDANLNTIFWRKAPLPCRLITNSQGLRRTTDVEFPKTRVRVLCIGDSYTFGHAMHNAQCYPQLLERLHPQLEVINAGVSGYTICDQCSYFEERGRYLQPDIVVLQVMPNDLDGFRPELQRLYCRGGAYCPTKGERR